MNIAMRTRIKRLREEKGISQSQMAEKLHIDERNYKRIESGEKKTMDIDLLSRIAEIFETDITELLTESVYIEHAGETINHNSGSAIVNNGEINVTNGATSETASLILEMKAIIEANRETMTENIRIITMLLKQQDKR